MTTTNTHHVTVRPLPRADRVRLTVDAVNLLLSSDQACQLAQRLIDAASRCLDQGPR
jgi:hypothetical protein